MFKKTSLLVAAAVATLAPAAHAQDIYAGASFAFVNIDDGFVAIDMSNVNVVAGAEVFSGFAAEGELGFTVVPAADTFFAGDEFTLGHTGIYGRYNLDLGGGTSAFARVGFISGSLDYTLGATASSDVSGIAYGGGVELEVSNGISLRGDVTLATLEDDFGFTADMTSLGIGVVMGF